MRHPKRLTGDALFERGDGMRFYGAFLQPRVGSLASCYRNMLSNFLMNPLGVSGSHNCSERKVYGLVFIVDEKAGIKDDCRQVEQIGQRQLAANTESAWPLRTLLALDTSTPVAGFHGAHHAAALR
jgi:hypothetical protein